MRNVISLLFMGIILCACGSIKTIGKTNEQIIAALNKDKGNCSIITRVYSGVGYDLCILNKPGEGSYHDGLLGFYIFDLGASALVDTIALPYTAYEQFSHGSVSVK